MSPEGEPAAAVAASQAARGGTDALIDGLLDAVWLIDAASLRVTLANAAAEDLLGLQAGGLTGRHVHDLAATPEDRLFWAAPQGLMDSETLVRRFSDGCAVPVMRRVRPVSLAGGAPGYLVVLRDCSAQRRVEEELEERLSELAATLESTADGILVTDLAGRVRNFNRKFAALWNLPDALLAGRQGDAVLDWMRDNVSDPAAYGRQLAQVDDATRFQTTDVIHLRNGRALERETLPQRSRGRPIGRVFSFRDITERLEYKRRLNKLSQTDGLTGLPNQGLLGERVNALVALAERDHAPFALMLANLDHFKHINDTLGHVFGDRALVEVAERLQACLRHGDTVARLGGDEFVLLLPYVDQAAAEAAARRVIDAMQRPFTLGDVSLTLTCSVGVVLCPAGGAGHDELLHRARVCLREVKQAGRANFRVHGPEPATEEARQRLRRHLQLDHAMRQALQADRFRLHFQPLVDVKTGEVCGGEALIRWTDPDLGDVAPDDLIAVAEQSGFIVPLGDWVLRQAVRQAAEWHAQGRRLRMSVNVSALQFQQPGFVDDVAAVLQQSGLPPEWLELELTESILIQHAQAALLRVRALAALGVRLSIDDFGTGYSSLAYLKHLPIGRLKIDRSFVQGLPGDPGDVGIVNAIIQLGSALGLEVVAEGVETEAQRQFLAAAGCAQYQGFLHAPAVDAQAFVARQAGSTG